MLDFSPFALSLSKGCLWFDKLTTKGLKTTAIIKHDKVKLLSQKKTPTILRRAYDSKVKAG
jgi:hypothetical protein